MAEITTAAHSAKPGVRRSKKLSTRVDLTPMVDLGFLLITFFIFTTTMSQPKALGLKMPANGDPQKLGKSSAMTVLALDNERLFYYFGDLSDKISGITDYKLNGGIGDIIRAKQKEMDQTVKGGRKELMLLIKPTSASNYRNVVQLLDETAINDIKKYALVDPDPAEEAEAKKSLNP